MPFAGSTHLSFRLGRFGVRGARAFTHICYRTVLVKYLYKTTYLCLVHILHAKWFDL